MSKMMSRCAALSALALCLVVVSPSFALIAAPKKKIAVPVQVDAPAVQVQPAVPAQPVPAQPPVQVQPGVIQIQIDPAVGPIQIAPGQIAPAQPVQVDGPDLQKQIEDALKELDKLKDIPAGKPDELKKQIEDVRNKLQQRLPLIINNRQIFIGPGGVNPIGVAPIARFNQNRLGIQAQKPTQVVVEQLTLPAGKGIVVGEVLPDSAAAKAGIKKYDILLEIDGKSVSSDLVAFQKELREFKTDVEMKAVVMRAGVKESIKSLKLPEAQAEVIRPGVRPLPFQIQPGIQIVPPGGVGFGGGAGFGGAAGGALPVIPPQAGVAGGGFGGIGGAFPALPGGVVAGNIKIQAGNGEALAVTISDNEFSIQSTTAGNKTTIRGTRADGKSTPTDITIEEGETTVRANSVAQVPERFRASVNRLLENVK